MNSLRCSNCSLLNFDTASACKRCGLPFNSDAGTEGDSHQYVPSATYQQQPTEGGSYFWDQPSYQPSYIPQPAPSSSVGKKIIGAVVFLAVMGLVAFVAMPKLLKSKKTDFTNLSWNEYRAPDGTFSVSMPVAPKEASMNQMTAAGNVQVRVVTAEVGKDGGCMVMYADYPVISKMSEDTLYDQMLKGMASSDKLAIGARKYITQDGHQGLEVEFQPPALQKLEAKGVARLFWVAPRLYMVMAGGPETAEFASVSQRCLDSFKFSHGQ